MTKDVRTILDYERTQREIKRNAEKRAKARAKATAAYYKRLNEQKVCNYDCTGCSMYEFKTCDKVQ